MDDLDKLFGERLQQVAPTPTAQEKPQYKYGHLVTPELLDSLEQVESRGKANAIGPPNATGQLAEGSFQFLPSTVKMLANQGYTFNPKDRTEARGGAEFYLNKLLEQNGGDINKALGSYGGHVTKDPAPYVNKVLNGMKPAKTAEADPLDALFAQRLESTAPAEVAPEQQSINSSTDKNVTVNYNENSPMVQDENTSGIAGKSNLELGYMGAKKSLTDLGQGAKQLLDMPAQFLEKKFKDTAVGKFGAQMGMPTAEQSAAQTNKDVEAERESSKELMGTGAGLAGYIGGSIAQTALGGVALKGAGLLTAGSALLNPQSYKAAATAGAALGALQPTTQGESKLMNTAAGAILGTAGQGLVNAAGAIAQPVKMKLDEMSKVAVDTLRKAGVPLDAAQATGSTFLARVKSALSDNLVTAGKQAEMSANQQVAFTKAVSKTMGEDAGNITPEVLQRAQNRIGQMYDDVAAKVNIKVDPSFQKSLTDITQEAQDVLNPTQFAIIDKNIGNIFEKATQGGGSLSGEQYQAIKKSLDRLSKSGDSDIGSYAREMRDVLNKGLYDSAVNSGNLHLVDVLKKANKQWGNMRKIEDIALKDTGGTVSPSQLYNSLTSKSKRNAFYADDTALPDLARAGKMILPEKLPNSGTTARLMNQAALGGAGAAIGSLYNGDVSGIASGAAIGIGAPKAAQMLINNPNVARYLEKGLSNVTLRTLLQTPKAIGMQKIPSAGFGAYTQSQQKPR